MFSDLFWRLARTGSPIIHVIVFLRLVASSARRDASIWLGSGLGTRAIPFSLSEGPALFRFLRSKSDLLSSILRVFLCLCHARVLCSCRRYSWERLSGRVCYSCPMGGFRTCCPGTVLRLLTILRVRRGVRLGLRRIRLPVIPRTLLPRAIFRSPCTLTFLRRLYL